MKGISASSRHGHACHGAPNHILRPLFLALTALAAAAWCCAARPALAGDPSRLADPPEGRLESSLAAPDFPHVACYLTLNSDGHQLGTDEALAKLARFQLAVIPASPATEYYGDRLRRLKTLNHGMRLFAYFPADFMWDGTLYPQGNVYGDCWRMFQRHGWWLYATDGQPYQYFGYTFDLTNPQAQDSLAAFISTRVMGSGLWDGLFLDDLCESIWWKQSYTTQLIDLNRDGIPDLQAVFEPVWKTGTDSLAAKLRRRLGPSVPLTGNCAYGSKWTVMNGWMREDFPRIGTWTTNMFSASGGYLVNEQKYLAPRYNFVYSTSEAPPSQYSTANTAFMRYCLASTLLGDGYFMFDPRVDSLLQSDYWFDEYDGGGRGAGYLGNPTGGYYQQVGALGTPDLLTNTGFESGLTNWAPYSTVGAILADPAVHAEGSYSAHMVVPTATAYTSQVHLQQALNLPYNTSWSVTYWARAAVKRDMWVSVQRTTAPFTIYCNTPVSVDTAWKQYQVSFYNTGTTVPVNFQLQFGQQVGDAWVDGVHLQSGASSVYRRDFAHGTVVLNNNRSTVTVPLAPGYYRMAGHQDPLVNSGAAVTQVTLGATSAVILVTNPPVSPAAAPSPGNGAAAVRISARRNPAVGGTSFDLELPAAAEVDLTVLDVAGRVVARLAHGPLPAGRTACAWDGRAAGGGKCAAGVYFVRAVARSGGATSEHSARILLLR